MPKEVYVGQKKKGQEYLAAGNLKAEEQDDFARLTAVTNQA